MTLFQRIFGTTKEPLEIPSLAIHDDEVKGRKLIEETNSDQLQWKEDVTDYACKTLNLGEEIQVRFSSYMSSHFVYILNLKTLVSTRLDISDECKEALYEATRKQKERLIHEPDKALFWEALKAAL